MHKQFCWETLKEGDHLEDLGIDENDIKWNSRKWEAGRGLVSSSWGREPAIIFASSKGGEFVLAQRLLSSEEEICFLELFSSPYCIAKICVIFMTFI
jgi:hypothetical protein